MDAIQAKQQTIRLLRKSGMLSGVEYLHFLYDQARFLGDNRKFLSEIPDFKPPPKRAMHDAYATTSIRAYWDGGLITAKSIAAIIKKYRDATEHIFEWGC